MGIFRKDSETILELLERVTERDLKTKEEKLESVKTEASAIVTDSLSTNIPNLEKLHGHEMEVVREIDQARRNLEGKQKLETKVKDDIQARLEELHRQEADIVDYLINQFGSILPVNTDSSGKPILKVNRKKLFAVLEDYKSFCDKAHARRLDLLRKL